MIPHEEHMRRLYAIEDALSNVKLADEYVEAVILNWLDNVAPSKNAEYGTECWDRLGPKALVVDISACFYRYKHLRAQGKKFRHPAMENAIVDAFGYAMLYNECTILKYPNDIPDNLSALYVGDWGEWDRYDPQKLNEWLITRIWNLQAPLYEEALVPVMVQPYRMWEELQ